MASRLSPKSPRRRTSNRSPTSASPHQAQSRARVISDRRGVQEEEEPEAGPSSGRTSTPVRRRRLSTEFWSAAESPIEDRNAGDDGDDGDDDDDDDVLFVTACNNTCSCCRKLPIAEARGRNLRQALDRKTADHRQATADHQQATADHQQATADLLKLQKDVDKMKTRMDHMNLQLRWVQGQLDTLLLDARLQDGYVDRLRARAGETMGKGHQKAFGAVLNRKIEQSNQFDRVLREVTVEDKEPLKNLLTDLKRGAVDCSEERIFGKVMSFLGDLSALHNDKEWETRVNSVILDVGSAITNYKSDVAPNDQGQRYRLRRRSQDGQGTSDELRSRDFCRELEERDINRVGSYYRSGVRRLPQIEHDLVHAGRRGEIAEGRPCDIDKQTPIGLVNNRIKTKEFDLTNIKDGPRTNGELTED